jgi:hypothetical protein
MLPHQSKNNNNENTKQKTNEQTSAVERNFLNLIKDI